MRAAPKLRQAGATLIEFALVLLIFLAFMLGVVDFSRMLFTWNAATQVTRAGARYAVVCDDTSKKAEVLARMQMMLPQITDIDVTWSPPSCTADSPTNPCQGVTVSITGLDFQWISPVPGAIAPTMAMPGFSTYLTREIMRQDPAVYPTVCS
jgi:hypothetical protein